MVTLASGVPRKGRFWMEIVSAGLWLMSNFSSRATLLPSLDNRKFTTDSLPLLEKVMGRFSNPGNSLLLVAPIATSTFGGTSNCERTRTSILRFSCGMGTGEALFAALLGELCALQPADRVTSRHQTRVRRTDKKTTFPYSIRAFLLESCRFPGGIRRFVPNASNCPRRLPRPA